MGQQAANGQVLIVDDNINALRALEYVLDREGFSVDCAASGSIALERIKKASYDVVVSDLKMPGMDGFTLLGQIQSIRPDLPVVILTAHGTIDSAVTAVRKGACDYLQKPFHSSEIASKLRAALGRTPTAAVTAPTLTSAEKADAHEMVGTAASVQRLRAQMETIARKDITVLLNGESGTGKEIAAGFIHRCSPRKDRPFVAVNCTTIPETLLENELFGHVKGAYTGANSNQRGLFEEADTGTLFLDEIGDIPTSIQAKLLRVLQEKEFKKIGGTRDVRVDVRVITATNRDLKKAVADGTFREDLFYRINVVPIELPPLRERADDIPQLCNHFRLLFNAEMSLTVQGFSDDALSRLITYPWPGNIRELKNRVKMAMVMATEPIITPTDLAFDELEAAPSALPIFSDAKASFERDYVLKALRICAGNVKKAARMAGRDRSTFYDLLKKHEISADTFRDLY